MSGTLLEVRDLAGGYEPVQIFQNVSLTMSADTSIGLFGPNGHGKTTFLRTLSGIIDPWRGDILFEGQQLNRPGERGSRRFRNFNYDAVTRRRMNPKQVARAGLIHVPLLYNSDAADDSFRVHLAWPPQQQQKTSLS